MEEKKVNAPKVSVVIATKNRADLLGASIHSVLQQTMKDFELIVVDDGSTDGTKELVESINDERVIYATTGDQSQGISAARNLGAKLSRGDWTAVHDDDDLMVPTRLEVQLAQVEADIGLVYGAFVNFDDDCGTLELHHGRNYTYGAALQTGFAPGHSTWLVRTRLLQLFQYDEGLESAVDNNIAFRLLKSGVKFKHCGEIVLLRRVHNRRITSTGGGRQKYAAELNLRFLGRGVNPEARKRLWKKARYDWGPLEKEQWQMKCLPLLPDSLVCREGAALVPVDSKSDGDQHYEVVSVDGMSWENYYALLGSGGLSVCVKARYRESDTIESRLMLGSRESELPLRSVAASFFGSKFIADKDAQAFIWAVVDDLNCAISDDWQIVLFEQGEVRLKCMHKRFGTVWEALRNHERLNNLGIENRFFAHSKTLDSKELEVTN